MHPRLRSRQPQVDVLRGQLDALGAGRGSVVLVTGPAGSGKTTLLAEAASLAADGGIGVFCGGGDPAARAVPLGGDPGRPRLHGRPARRSRAAPRTQPVS